jgi:hypothetical protein
VATCVSFAATRDGAPEASPSRLTSRTDAVREIDGAQREGVGDVQRPPRTGDAAGQGQRARDHGADRAALAVDLVDRVVRHVGHEEAAVGREGEIVEVGRGRGDALLLVRRTIDVEHLAGRVVDGMELAVGIEVRGGRRREALGDDLQGAAVDVETDDLGAEPERAAESAVRSEVEAVEAAEVLADEARGLLALALELPERVGEEDLGPEEAATGVEGEGVHPGQAAREDANAAVGIAGAQRAVHEAGEVERAVGGELEIVGLALGRGDRDLGASVLRVDAVDRLAHHAPDPDRAVGVDRETMDPAEGAAGNEPVALPFGGGGVADARDESEQQGEEGDGRRSTRHGAVLDGASQRLANDTVRSQTPGERSPTARRRIRPPCRSAIRSARRAGKRRFR